MWHHRTHTREFRVRCALSENKKKEKKRKKEKKKKEKKERKKKRLYLTQEPKNALPQPDDETAANLYHRCRYSIIDNVAL